MSKPEQKPSSYLEDIAKILDFELVDKGGIQKLPKQSPPVDISKVQSKPIDDLLNSEAGL